MWHWQPLSPTVTFENRSNLYERPACLRRVLVVWHWQPLSPVPQNSYSNLRKQKQAPFTLLCLRRVLVVSCVSVFLFICGVYETSCAFAAACPPPTLQPHLIPLAQLHMLNKCVALPKPTSSAFDKAFMPASAHTRNSGATGQPNRETELYVSESSG